MEARVAELLAAGVPAEVVGWVAHRTGSAEAQDLLDAVAVRSGDPFWLAAAGYERGTRATTPEELRRAAAQLSQAIESAALPARYEVLLVELLLQLREDARLAQLRAAGRLRSVGAIRGQMVDADVANPFRTPGLPEDRWLQIIAPLFGDLVPVGLGPVPLDDAYEPLDRLMAPIAPATRRGELVSVIVSSYRPGHALETAVRSMIAQTWADLEILVIDDASGPDFADVYARVEALDERVRVIRQPANGGTYVARNTAIDQARGTYVTFQDADDWSHPQRTERQVAVLEQDPLVHAVRAQSLRTSGSLVFARQGTAVRAPAAATLMFRRQQVWPALGGYDVVRKAADTEFHERIAVALPGYDFDLEDPLMWVRLGEGSLSRSEFRANWKHPARLLYRSAFGHWHEQIRLGASPRLDRSHRRFPAPQRFRVDQTPADEEFDLVVLGDWRGDGSVARDAVDWMRVLADDGVRIAAVHVESLNFDGRRPSALMPSAQELVATGAVEVVPWDSELAARAFVAIEPEVLEYLPDTDPGTRLETLIVLLDGTPRSAALVGSAEAIAHRRWDAKVVWCPRGGAAPTETIRQSDMLAQPFPLIMPGESVRPLHRPDPVVVVAPMGISPAVLDESAALASELAGAGVDVRVRLAAGLRQSVRRRANDPSARIFWASSTNGAAAAEVAVATDVIVVGDPVGTDFERLADDARRWGVRLHVERPRDRPVGDAADDGAVARSTEDSPLVQRVLAGGPVGEDRSNVTHDRAAANEAVRSWYEAVKAVR